MVSTPGIWVEHISPVSATPGRRESEQSLRNVTWSPPRSDTITHLGAELVAWPNLDGAGTGVCLAPGRKGEVDIAEP